MRFCYLDEAVAVCLKPPGVLSTDEPGGMPELVRQALGTEEIRTVHRLDRAAGGLMVLARSAAAAAELSRQIREDLFEKEYLAVVHGDPGEGGELRDLLLRDKARKMSFVTQSPGKGVQEALLEYRRLARSGELSLVRVKLRTGRTHQIRCQFSSRGWELAGERKYSTRSDPWPLALWSARVGFLHPVSGERLSVDAPPPDEEPWSLFDNQKIDKPFS